jgi:hypothetical protein
MIPARRKAPEYVELHDLSVVATQVLSIKKVVIQVLKSPKIRYFNDAEATWN